MPHTPSIKCEKMYRALLREGHDKESAARISNAAWRRGECGGKKEAVTTKAHTGIMVALFLPVAVSNGIMAMWRNQFDLSAVVTPADELHITLMYLGDTNDTALDPAEVYGWLAEFGARQNPITGRLNGIGRFNSMTSDGAPVYLSFDSPQLPAFRQGLVDFFEEKGISIEFNHGFTPHITLAYTPNLMDGWNIDVPPEEITLDELTLAFGGQRYVVGLGQAEPMSAFTVTKDAKGEWRWLAVSSTAYEDRDGEIVSLKALEEDVARADRDGDYGPLLWWHTDAALGQCDFNAMHGRMLVESGTFVSPYVAKQVRHHADALGLSIGFRHPATEPHEGVYHTIRRKERSVLPEWAASNVFTRLSVKGEDMDGRKEAELRRLFPQEADAMLAAIEGTDKAAAAAGVRTKEKKAGEEVPGLKGFFGRLMGTAKEHTDPTPEPDDEDDTADDVVTDDGTDADSTTDATPDTATDTTDDAAPAAVVTDGGEAVGEKAAGLTEAQVRALFREMLDDWGAGQQADADKKDADKKKEADTLRAEVETLKAQLGTLTSDQPRIFGFGGFRPSTDASTINADKTKEAKEKASATTAPQTPMDGALALADAFLGDQ